MCEIEKHSLSTGALREAPVDERARRLSKILENFEGSTRRYHDQEYIINSYK